MNSREFFKSLPPDSNISIKRRKIEIFVDRNEAQFHRVRETYTIQNTSLRELNQFYINIEIFRMNLVVKDYDGDELPFTPREDLTSLILELDTSEKRGLKDFGVLYISLPNNKVIRKDETRIFYLEYLYRIPTLAKVKEEVPTLVKLKKAIRDWLTSLFFNEEYSFFGFDSTQSDNTYLSIVSNDDVDIKPIILGDYKSRTNVKIDFQKQNKEYPLHMDTGKGYLFFYINKEDREKFGLNDSVLFIFESFPEIYRSSLVKVFSVVLGLGAISVYIYEYRFLFENLGHESSMFILILTLLVSVFTLSLLPIHSRAIKFRRLILYSSYLVFGAFVIPTIYLVIHYLIPILIANFGI